MRRLRVFLVLLSAVTVMFATATAPAMAGNGDVGKRAYWSAKRALCALGYKSFC